MDTLRYRFIHELSEAEYVDLYRIMSNPEITKWLSDGRPWTPAKMLALREFSAKDFTRAWRSRDYFYWAILAPRASADEGSEARVVGIIGIHPALPAVGDGLQIMFAIKDSERGHHYAARAVRDIMALEKIRTDKRAIFATVRADNAPSLRTIEASGEFRETSRIEIDGETFVVYRRKEHTSSP